MGGLSKEQVDPWCIYFLLYKEDFNKKKNSAYYTAFGSTVETQKSRSSSAQVLFSYM